MCSLAFSSQTENSNTIFASDKLENSNDPVKIVSNIKIYDTRYQLNTVTASDAQVKFLSDPEKLLTPETELLIKNID